MKGKILLWDDFYVDQEKTTAKRVIHHAEKKERVITFDCAWEGDGCDFFHIVKTDKKYRMYYNGRSFVKKSIDSGKIKICMIESDDGKNWSRPLLGKIEFFGDSNNNIVKDSTEFNLDNFYVFYDENPNCKETERFKAIAMVVDDETVELACYISADGIEFKRSHAAFEKIYYRTEEYRKDVIFFDTLNVVFWDKSIGKYRMFVRGLHDIPESELPPGNERDRNLGIRDIRYSESDDFIHWTEPERLAYDTPDCPLYTSAVTKYCSAPDMYIGFPTRYNERFEWDDSFEQLCGKQVRKYKMEKHENRLGLAITDCLFMFSRDAKNWIKFDEAYFTPGAEGEPLWTYGSCYPCVGVIQTKPGDSSVDEELSMFMPENGLSGKDVELYRYTIRQDGFISYYGDYAEKTLITKEFKMEEIEEIRANFSTSAAGFMQINIILDNGEKICSQKHFGDKVDRLINFDKPLKNLCGHSAKMEIVLKDAHIYSLEIK